MSRSLGSPPVPEPRTTTAPPARQATAILAIICISYFMVILDNSIIFTGLPRIEAAMRFSPAGLTWVQDAYTLVFGGLLLLGARAGDIAGRRRMFTIGLVLFGLASLLVGAASAAWWLVAARAVRGVGAAILAPSSLALLTATFPEGRQRARAVAAYSAVAGIGASLGLVIGGVLAGEVSWRAGFFLNVPVGLLMVVAARRFITETGHRAGRFDLAGALCATLGMTALVFAIVNSASSGWGSPLTIGVLLAGVLLLAGLVFNEARAEQPIMPLRLFASRQRAGAYLVRMLYLGAMMGFFFFTTQYLQVVPGFTPLQAGLAFLPMSAGMAWLSRAGAGSSYLTAVALPMVLIGAGQGLAFAPMTSAGLSGVGRADVGAASGLVNTFHQVGSALGLPVLTAVGIAAVPAGAPASVALTDRVSTALTAGSLLLTAALAATVALIARRRPERRTAGSAPAADVRAAHVSGSR